MEALQREGSKFKLRRNFLTVKAIKQQNSLPPKTAVTGSWKQKLDPRLSGMVGGFLPRTGVSSNFMILRCIFYVYIRVTRWVIFMH